MKIYLLGDIGEFNNNTNKIINNIKNDKSNKIILILGDNFYPDGINDINDNQWKKFEEQNIDFPTWGILGNHDYLGNVKAQIEYKKNNWNIPNFFYKKSFDFIDFFFIDTSILLPEFCNLNYNIVKSKLGKEPLQYSKEMLDWLNRELKKCSKLKMVVGHYPISSFGIYGINKRLFKILFPIFKKHNVKYYISGHDHNLQIVDIYTIGYEMKQIISAGCSHLYPTLNSSNKVFSKFGTVMIDTKEHLINVLDENLNLLYKEDIIY